MVSWRSPYRAAPARGLIQESEWKKFPPIHKTVVLGSNPGGPARKKSSLTYFKNIFCKVSEKNSIFAMLK